MTTNPNIDRAAEVMALVATRFWHQCQGGDPGDVGASSPDDLNLTATLAEALAAAGLLADPADKAIADAVRAQQDVEVTE